MLVLAAQSCLTLDFSPQRDFIPLSMGFSRQEYWSELPFSSAGHPPDPGIKALTLVSPKLAGGFFTTSPSWEVLLSHTSPYIWLKEGHPKF